MPPTLKENADQINELKERMNEKDVREAKIDMILETLTKSIEMLHQSYAQFQEALNTVNTTIQVQQEKNKTTWMVIQVVGGILLTCLGVVAGQYLHLYPR